MTKLILTIFLTIFPVTPDQSGKISYYGEGNWHGSITANGETFKPYGKTCASRTLDFGTILLIENQQNNKLALCRVNDRGPFDIVDSKPVVDLNSKYERILDVSVGVANMLDMKSEGIVKANIYIVKKP